MVIHDVEYQFDRHKLTVYYAADSRVDFREFVRDLFSAYKARIWMKKLNTQRPIKLENWATVALATGMQFSPDNK
jgi:cell fate regulator YaaT (PSP1 superfamily)